MTENKKIKIYRILVRLGEVEIDDVPDYYRKKVKGAYENN